MIKRRYFLQRAKALCLRTLAVIVLCLSAFGIVQAVLNLQTNADSDTWAENELPIESIADTMYVTLLDDKLRVISTTNPETKVDTVYNLDGSTPPNKLETSDKLKIYLEFKLADDAPSRISTDKNYYLTLPDGLVPDEKAIIGSENGPSAPITLLSSSTIKADGGIFKNEANYKFRVMFSAFEDQMDIVATYQYDAEFNQTLFEHGYGAMSFDYGAAGIVQAIVRDPQQPDEIDNEFTVYNHGEWLSKTEQHAQWQTEILDNKQNRSIDAIVRISLSDYMAAILDHGKENYPETINNGISVYADGDLSRQCRYDSESGVVHCDYLKNGNVYAYTDQTFTCPITADGYLSSRQCLYDSVEVKLRASDVQNWRISVDAWVTSVTKIRYGSGQVYSQTTNFMPSDGEPIITSKTLQPTGNGNNITSNGYEQIVRGNKNSSSGSSATISDVIPEKITSEYSAKTSSNFAKFVFDPDDSTIVNRNSYESSYRYFVEQPTNPGTLSGGFELEIDGREVAFNSGLNNGLGEMSIVQLKKIAEIYGVSNSNVQLSDLFGRGYMLMSSSRLDPDGNPYVLIMTPEKYKTKSDSYPYGVLIDCLLPGSSSCGNSSTAKYGDQYVEGNLEINLLNVANQNIDISVDTIPGYIKYVDHVTLPSSKEVDKMSHSLTMATQPASDGSDKKAAHVYTFNRVDPPITASGVVMNNGTVRWNLEIDNKALPYKYMSRFSSRSQSLSLRGAENPPFVSTRFDGSSVSTSEQFHDLRFHRMAPPTAFFSDLAEKDIPYQLGGKGTYAQAIYANRDVPYAISNDGFNRGCTLDAGAPIICFGGAGALLSSSYLNVYEKYSDTPRGQYSIHLEKYRNWNNDKDLLRTSFFVPYESSSSVDFFENKIGLSLHAGLAGMTTTTVLDILVDAKAYNPTTEKSLVSSKNYVNDDGHLIAKKEWKVKQTIQSSTYESYYNDGYRVAEFANKLLNTTTNQAGDPISKYTKLTQFDLRKNNETKTFFSSSDENNAFEQVRSVAEYGVAVKSPDYAAKLYTVDNFSTSNYSGPVYVEQGEFASADDDENVIAQQGLENGFYINVYSLPNDVYDVELYYTTETDLTEFLKNDLFTETDSIDLGYTSVTFRNNPDASSQTENSSIDVRESFAALLSLSRESGAKSAAQVRDQPYKNSFKLKAEIGLSGAPELQLTDFVSGYKDGSAEYIIEKTDQKAKVQELVKHLSLTDKNGTNTLKIQKVIDSSREEYETIYENGEFKDGWQSSTIEFYDDDADGRLFTVTIKHIENGELQELAPADEFQVSYDLNLDMSDNSDDTIYRQSDNYDDGALQIYTNTRALRSFIEREGISGGNTSPAQDIESLDDSYKNYIDGDKLVCFAGSGAYGNYLSSRRRVQKNIISEDKTNGHYRYRIDLNMESQGKEQSLSEQLNDQLTLTFSNAYRLPEQFIEKANMIFKRHASISNVKVEYSKLHTDTQSYTNNHPIVIVDSSAKLESGQPLEASIANGASVSVGYTNNDIGTLSARLDNLQYDDQVSVYYNLDLDLPAIMNEISQEISLSENTTLENWYSNARIEFNNIVALASDQMENSSSRSQIRIGDYAPSIKKTHVQSQDMRSDWKIEFEVGDLPSGELQITDKLEISAVDNIKNAVLSSISNRDFVIKLDDAVIYDSRTTTGYAAGYSEANFEIAITSEGFVLTLKDTPSMQLTGGRKKYEIQYCSEVDKEAFAINGLPESGAYALFNTSTIQKGQFKSTSNARAQNNFNYPIELEKEATQDDTSADKISYKVKVSPSEIDRYAVNITDSYRGINRIVSSVQLADVYVKIGDTIYDPTELPTGYSIKLGGERNNNEQPAFSLRAEHIPMNTPIEIGYSLVVDRELAQANDCQTNYGYTIYNQAYLTAQNITKMTSKSADIVVPELFKKDFSFTQSRTGDKAIVKWTIDVNLLADFAPDQLPETATVGDQLQSALTYIDGSLHVYDSNGASLGQELVLDEDYSFDYENNKLVIRIIDAKAHPIVKIKFETECLSSISELQNQSTLEIDGEEFTAISTPIQRIFAPYIAGTVSSKQAASYRFIGQVNLDDRPSPREFDFEIAETDCNGNIINRRTIRSDAAGNVDFGSLNFTQAGERCYLVSEINDGDDKIDYDSNSFTIKITIKDEDGKLIIESSLDNGEKIVFNNYTKRVAPENPHTVDDIAKSVVAFVLFAGAGLLYRARSKR